MPVNVARSEQKWLSIGALNIAAEIALVALSLAPALALISLFQALQAPTAGPPPSVIFLCLGVAALLDGALRWLHSITYAHRLADRARRIRLSEPVSQERLPRQGILALALMAPLIVAIVLSPLIAVAALAAACVTLCARVPGAAGYAAGLMCLLMTAQGEQISFGVAAASVLLAFQFGEALERAFHEWPSGDDAGRKVVQSREDKTPLRLPDRPPSIRVSNLFLKNNRHIAMRHCSFDIEPGALTAIRHDHTSNARLLLENICGLATVQSGNIRLNGLSPQEYRQALGPISCLATLDDALFDADLMRNITLLGHGSSERDAQWAADLLGFTAMEMNAFNQSASAREALAPRVVLARALARRPRLMLIDGVIDELNHSEVSHALSALKRLRGEATIIVATESDQIVLHADQHLQWRNKTLADTGLRRPKALQADASGTT
jgi:ABC-type transport system involved in cytochrome bd biosynthesis fused ATPase/permease subunit